MLRLLVARPHHRRWISSSTATSRAAPRGIRFGRPRAGPEEQQLQAVAGKEEDVEEDIEPEDEETGAEASVKSQTLPSGLWVVATPLGNLADMSPRGKQALLQADLVLCEDTRRTTKLMYAIGAPWGFKAKLRRYDAFASEASVSQVVRELTGGAKKNVALVTDAGTPSISDPGSRLVAACHSSNIQITPVPGCSAVSTLLSVCGFDSTSFTFRGFFPRKDKERREEINALRRSKAFSGGVGVWFESPNRIEATLEVLREETKEGAVLCAAKELTKMHERVFQGPVHDVIERILELPEENEVSLNGEWCFALDLSREVSEDDSSAGGSEEWKRALECCIACGAAPSEAVKQVVARYGEDTSKKIAYEYAINLGKAMKSNPEKSK